MTSVGWDLQKAVYAALIANAQLTTLLGAERIYDSPPQAAAFPYIVIDQMQIRDWRTGTEKGFEHILMLHIWSRCDGKREVYDIADAMRAVLDDAEMTLDAHRLVSFTHQYSDLKRDEDGKTFHGIMRFRALTEPLD